MILFKHRKTPRIGSEGKLFGIMRSVLGWPGSVLLFQALRLSTIGAEDFDGRVRNGIG